MEKIFFSIKLLTSVIIVMFLSCKKEAQRSSQLSSPFQQTNKTPVAYAGPDIAIMLPVDSVILDGSLSYDADGSITNYRWKRITGPNSFQFVNTSAAKATVKQLIRGIYSFELTVQDDKGWISRDTAYVFVNDPAIPNVRPIADAGSDQIIVLPLNNTFLSGSGTDADGFIVSYNWQKISGPSQITIVNPGASVTEIKDLAEGIYEFELTVTDNNASTGTDKVVIVVQVARAQVNMQLVTVGNLSLDRVFVASATAGDKIFFAGGSWGEQSPDMRVYSRVDIYNLNTQTWLTAELSEARTGIGAVVVGNKVLFAGGAKSFDYGSGWYDLTKRIDIYDVITNTWTIAELPEPINFLWWQGVATAVGNKAIFCGGSWRNKAYVYDVAANTWLTVQLSVSRYDFAAASLENKLFIAGKGDYVDGRSKRVDIYNALSETWSIDSLSEIRSLLRAGVLNNRAFFAAGNIGGGYSSKVDIYNNASQTWSVDYLSRSTVLAGIAAAGQSLLFFGGHRVDIYDEPANRWFIADIPPPLSDACSIISTGGQVYVVNGSTVWRVAF